MRRHRVIGKCLVCDATLTLKRTEMPYCKTRACASGYAPILVERRTHLRDGHTIWSGSYHPHTGRPYCNLVYLQGGHRHNLTVNPMHVLWEKQGGRLPGWGQTVTRACDEARCVGHLAIKTRSAAKKQAPPAPVKAPRLPVMPLVRLIAARGAEFSLPESDYSAVKWAQDGSGQIDLYVADRICIESLNIHPYFVWGQLFFEAK